jgi:preprotein translocase subunit SecB
MTETHQPALKLHAIQLRHVFVNELLLRNFAPAPDERIELDSAEFQMQVRHSDYREKSKDILVEVSVSLGDEVYSEETSPFPFFLKVALTGRFSVDLTNFSREWLEIWAQQNAPMILFPFVREHLYGLSSRGELPKLLFPLIQVPTLQTTE